MAWSLTIDKLPEYEGPTLDDFERIARDNISSVDDMLAALQLATQRGMASCVLSGGRTPTPANDDEVIDISIHGMAVAKELQAAIRDAIRSGPDDTTTLWDIEHGKYNPGTNDVPDKNGGR